MVLGTAPPDLGLGAGIAAAGADDLGDETHWAAPGTSCSSGCEVSESSSSACTRRLAGWLSPLGDATGGTVDCCLANGFAGTTGELGLAFMNELDEVGGGPTVAKGLRITGGGMYQAELELLERLS